jgi:exodeoxyribonuclease VII large subunit
LKRGYVRVTGADGRTLVSKTQAAGEASLVLHFGDGELGAAPLGAQPSAPPAKRATPSQKPPPPEQGKLL